MKLLTSLVPLAVTAEWVQPSYYDALQMAKQRKADWGFPVGVRAAADWQNCGTPTVAQGFDAGEELECSASTCMLKCPAGQIAVGKRRIRCRWKRKHGFFWKSQLGSCQGCEPTDPVASISDANITASCSINTKGKNICMLSCPTGMSLLGKNRQKMKCKCPRQAGGTRTCGWILKKSFIDATGLGGLACTGTATGGTTTGGTTGGTTTGGTATGGTATGGTATGGATGGTATGGATGGTATGGATGGTSGTGGVTGGGTGGTATGGATGGTATGGATGGTSGTGGATGGGTGGTATGGTAATPAPATPAPATPAPATPAPATPAPATPAPATPAPATPAPVTTAATSEKQTCLDTIPNEANKDAICDELVRVNVYRAEHNAAPLLIDPALCTSAAAKAAELALQNDSMCTINHDPANLQSVSQGENLYCGFGTGCMEKTIAQHMEIASKMWQHEIDDWNMAGCTDNTCSEANNCDGGADGVAPFGCGHFTQQIWKTTTHMCYQYSKGPDNREYVVARYSPPGNTNTLYHTSIEASSCAAAGTCSPHAYSHIGDNCSGK